MNARIQRLAVGAALMLAAACGRSGGDSADSTDTASAVTDLDRAVAVARAVRTNPAATDSILAAHDLTASEFNSLMYDIAADSALARAYTEAIR